MLSIPRGADGGGVTTQQLADRTFTRLNMGSVQPIGGGTASNIRTWFRRTPADATRMTYATSIEIDAPAGPVKVASAFVGADLIPVYHDIRTVQHPGGRAITTLVPPVEIPAGAHVGFRVAQAGTRLTTTVEDFWYSSTDPDALGQTAFLTNNESGSRYWSVINVDAGPGATALAAGQDAAVDAVAKASVIQSIGYGKLFDLASLPGQTSSAPSNLTIYTGPEFRAAFDATISGIRVWANIATVATITIYDVTETETTIAFSPVLSIRLNLEAGKNTLPPDLFRGVTVRQGQCVGISGAQLRYGFGGAGKLVPKISVESQQGAGFFVTKPVPQESWNIAFEVTLEAMAGDRRAPQREVALAAGPISLGDAGYVQTGVSGLTVWAQSGTSDIAIRRSTASVVIPLADAGQARYSMVCYNRFTDAWSVVAGPSRLRDAQAFRPAPAAGTDAMFLVRSGDASITEIFPVHRLGADGISATLRPTLDQALRRNRAMCPKLMRKIRARQPIRILSIGDSITQISQSAASATAPNGDRDRLKYLTENNVNQYGSDFIATVPRFTSAQIGRPGDSFTDHIKIGFIWELIAGLEAMGYTLGVDLFYDNFCRSGSATIDFVSDANVFSAWGQAALALPPYDLVITAWGMNELSEVGTGGRLILIANAFRALGSEMLMTDSSARKATWSQARINRDQTQRAAWAAGTAHASWQWVDGPQWGEGLSVAALDRVAANGTNHPGGEELGAFGKVVRYSMLGL